MNITDEKMSRLESMLHEQQTQLREQQAEIAALRKTLSRKTTSTAVPATPAEPALTRKPDTTRRKMLKRMGVAVLAGGAALGITAVTYAPAEAKLSINPTSKIGAIITRAGASITNIPSTSNFGLIASPDAPASPLDAGAVITSTNSTFSEVGISGLTNTTDATGVLGVSSGGYGVRGFGATAGVSGISSGAGTGSGVEGFSDSGIGVSGGSNSGFGVYGLGNSGIGVYGATDTAGSPAVNAKNLASTSGIALQIEKGGFTIKGAGVSSSTSSTAAFVHKTSTANILGNHTYINNPLCNGRQNALLFVIHNWNPTDGSGTYLNKAFGIFYDIGNSMWAIYTEDGTDLPNPTISILYFNVLIINP